MPIVSTNLRRTRESARQIRFEAAGAITATNVQNALEQIIATPSLVKPTTITSVQSPYTPSNADSVLVVDTSAGPVTINLLPGLSRSGLPLEIKDITGNAATNNITVVPNGAETIDGLAPYLIDSSFSSARFAPKTSGGYFVQA